MFAKHNSHNKPTTAIKNEKKFKKSCDGFMKRTILPDGYIHSIDIHLAVFRVD